jgi:hypothetical protein
MCAAAGWKMQIAALCELVIAPARSESISKNLGHGIPLPLRHLFARHV